MNGFLYKRNVNDTDYYTPILLLVFIIDTYIAFAYMTISTNVLTISDT